MSEEVQTMALSPSSSSSLPSLSSSASYSSSSSSSSSLLSLVQARFRRNRGATMNQALVSTFVDWVKSAGESYAKGPKKTLGRWGMLFEAMFIKFLSAKCHYDDNRRG